MHALIIEDDFLIALYLENLLRGQGFESCVFADTEEEAIAAARHRIPDIITADVRLRAGSGIAAVRTICEDRRLPVVYVTGNPDELGDAVPAAVVAKPFTDEELTRAVGVARAAAHP